MTAMTSHRHMVMDYHTVSQGRTSVPPGTSRPWYPDNAPGHVRHDPTLLLDIPPTSPAGGRPGPRHGDRPPSSSAQHLLTVVSPPTPTPPTDVSTMNPELRHAQKSGDLYNISVNINALQLAARPPSAAENTASIRRTKSLQNISDSWSLRPQSTPYEEPEAGTTVVQVRRDNEQPSPQIMSPSSSTLPTTQRQTRPVTRTPSIRTLRIPPSTGRRSRSASRASGPPPDEGYVIKSLKSTTEDVPSGRASTTRLASASNDSKVVFDVELMEQQRQQQLQQQHLQQQQQQTQHIHHQQWEVEQTTSQQVLSLSSTGPRSLRIESVTPSTSGRQLQDPRDQPLDPRDTSEPTYTMTMNQQMTMNYEPPPPMPSPQPPPQDVFDETVHHRVYHAASSGTTRSDAMAINHGYLADPRQSSGGSRSKKKKKQPRMVSSGTQMSFDKSTQMKPKTPKESDDEPVQRSKKPITKSPRKSPEPRMVSKATQMAKNKSTQITRPQESDDEDVTTSSDAEPQKARKMRTSYKSPVPSTRKKKTTNVGTQVTNRPKTPEYDLEQPMKRANRWESAVPNRPKTPEYDWEQPMKRANRWESAPVNGYPDEPLEFEDDIRPQRRERAQLPPNWSDGDSLVRPKRRQPVELSPNWPDMDSDMDRPVAPPRQQRPHDYDHRPDSRRSQDDPDRGVPRRQSRQYDDFYRPDSRRSQDDPNAYPDRPRYAEDFVDSGVYHGDRSPYEDNPVDDYIRPSPASTYQAPPPEQYPSDDPRNSDQFYADPSASYRPDYVTQPEMFHDYQPAMNNRPENWDSGTGQPSDMYTRNVDVDANGDRYTTVPVTVSAFNEEDEAHLQKHRLLENANSAGRRLSAARSSDRSKRQDEAKAVMEMAKQRMSNIETHFGWAEGSRAEFVKRLMHGAPKGSVKQWEHTEREEEEIVGPLPTRYGQEHASAEFDDENAMLNFDTVSEKVELRVAKGTADLMVKVRCERIVPVRGGVADLFKKTSVIVTRVIKVDLAVTAERQQLHDHIIRSQRASTTGRLPTRDTFDLYKTFVAMAEADEAAGRQKPHEVRIDQQVDEQRLLDLQLTASRPALPMTAAAADFRRVDRRLPDVDAEDVDFRSRGHYRPIDSSTAAMSTSVMAATRSRQRFYQS